MLRYTVLCAVFIIFGYVSSDVIIGKTFYFVTVSLLKP